jgi:hypothetical protein
VSAPGSPEGHAALRVLCYSPYTRWTLHAQWEMTILRSLKLRGADVRYVFCDGLYSDCDQFWEATEPRPANACVGCQAKVAQQALDLGMEYRWLGRHLMPEERREAQRWVASLAASELADATYGDWDVARWVVGSIHSHFRRSRLDVTDPRVEATWRSYLFSGLVACFALTRLLDDQRPDVMLQFNGRQSSTRIAFELARRRGIRVICHERAARTESLLLTENVHVADLEPYARFWAEWGDVALEAAELATIGTMLIERESGVGIGWKTLSPIGQSPEQVGAALGLDRERPIWVLFTSSDDEVASEPSWRGDFADQLDWIERTVAYAAAHPEPQLVIRVHPNTGSRRSHGTNREQLDALNALAERLPANVRMVAPDAEISSYALMELATVGLIYHSTVGLELACKGRATVVAAGSVIAGLPFVHSIERADAYEPLLDRLTELPAGFVDLEVQRLAWRFAYGLFYRVHVDFPLVGMTDPTGAGEVLWRGDADLRPGRDAGLDRIAGILLAGDPVCRPPDAAERARTTDDEDTFFSGEAPRAFTGLAFADELIADPALLSVWGELFSAHDDATLVIQTPADATEALVGAIGVAGLDREDAPDLLAVVAESDALTAVDMVFTRRAGDGVLPGVPRYSDETLAALRAFSRPA